MSKLILGVDEAGRGPLAGPVAVGIIAVSADFDVAEEFPGVADSKVLSEKKRDALYEKLLYARDTGAIQFHVAFASAEAIDARGIAVVIRECIESAVRLLAPHAADTRVLLDGSLRAPADYAQETIIGGDASVPLISLASIAAKVERDRCMKEFGEVYPQYGFGVHKGYGTQKHIAAIREHGLCALHRRSFCRNFFA